MDFTVSELKGIKSVRVLQVVNTLMLGLLFLPINMDKKFDDFYSDIVNLDREDQRKMLVDAVRFVELKDEEISACLAFVNDKNGIPITKANIGNYDAGQILEMIVEVCLEVLAIDVFFCQRKGSTNSLITA